MHINHDVTRFLQSAFAAFYSYCKIVPEDLMVAMFLNQPSKFIIALLLRSKLSCAKIKSFKQSNKV